jgi:hypothetical protein
MGLPCAHELQRRYRADQPVYLTLVHQHWHLSPSVCTTSTTSRQPMLLHPVRQIEGRENNDMRNPESGDLPSGEAEEESVSETSNIGYTSDARNDTLPDDPFYDNVILEPQAPEARPKTCSTRRDLCEFETVGARVRCRRAREATGSRSFPFTFFFYFRLLFFNTLLSPYNPWQCSERFFSPEGFPFAIVAVICMYFLCFC